MNPEPVDSELDSRLRQVALPDGLIERLRAAGPLADEELDRQLRHVPAVPGQIQRWRDLVADEWLDERLRELAVPADLTRRVRAIPLHRPKAAALRWAAAAALLLVALSGFWGSLGAVLLAIRPDAPTEVWLPVDQGPLRLESPPPVQVVLQDAPLADAPRWLPPPPVDIPPLPFPPGDPGPFAELRAELEGGLDPWDDVLLMAWEPLGAPQRDELVPELELVSAPVRQGIHLPRVPGFDRTFLMRHGVTPRISPAAHPRLQVAEVPLGHSTVSFELLRRRLVEGRLPMPPEVRVEDFLAATQYRFAPPQDDRVGLRTAAGPAIFGAPEDRLLQVGVAVGRGRPTQRRATHLVLVIDISASMSWQNRDRWAQPALEHLTGHLGAGDRVSVVVFNHEAFTFAELADRQELPAAIELLSEIRPHGGSNLAAGLQQALSVAAGGGWQERRQPRLVLVTDGRAGREPVTAERLGGLLRRADLDESEMVLACLGDVDDAEDPFDRLAAATGIRVRRAANPQQLGSVLVETLSGRSDIVAADARLRVEFNPQSVASYRLIGHDPTPLAVLAGAPLETDLHSQRQAQVLFEVRLRDGDDDLVAWANLEWRDPVSGQRHRLRQRISRLQFASSFAESALSLQSAALAAELAELLRESVFARGAAHSWDRLARQARRVNPRLAQDPGFREWLTVLEEVERIQREATAGK